MEGGLAGRGIGTGGSWVVTVTMVGGGVVVVVVVVRLTIRRFGGGR
ncbi:hypothetical protein SPZE110945_07290 [Sphingomonas zeae]